MTRLVLASLLCLAGCGDDAPAYYRECLAPGVARVFGPGDAADVYALPFCVSDVAAQAPGVEACRLAIEQAPTCAAKSPAVPL